MRILIIVAGVAVLLAIPVLLISNSSKDSKPSPTISPSKPKVSTVTVKTSSIPQTSPAASQTPQKKDPLVKALKKQKNEINKAYEDFNEDEIVKNIQAAILETESTKIYPLLKKAFDLMATSYTKAKGEVDEGRLENMMDSLEDLKDTAATLTEYQESDWKLPN